VAPENFLKCDFKTQMLGVSQKGFEFVVCVEPVVCQCGKGNLSPMSLSN